MKNSRPEISIRTTFVDEDCKTMSRAA